MIVRIRECGGFHPIMRSGEKFASEFSRWRAHMAAQIARQLDPARFGVAGVYLIGSAKNATAGPASDIDLLIHVRGTAAQRHDLEAWLAAWSAHLDELNYQQTGERTGGLLDVHLVTDEDLARQTSFAVKIGAISDAARKLPLLE